MAKQLNVNLAFTADTSGAKQQIQALVAELNKLSSNAGVSKDLPLTKEILEAQNAAKQLGQALEGALNVNTGKLDLTAFNQSLKQSGMTLDQYSSKLTMLGQNGDRAFLQVAQSIVNTQAPLRRSSKLLTEFATTLKNTARWQISSSILHGFMGAVQSAHGYAQDLNESLNNIRIVTGQNIDQMAKFAEQANKAAKALSTTTTEYTNAALIYYQQGDSDSTVLEKTDVTTKMANVTGQSAEVVSDQLTAIWNNFNKAGEESYEKYADVLTALGAATASSTDEIAGGLEKFASIADMIGLSYDYAATALATITATTRQSEDVVGTALKTIFARIQGLNLGETLDDGTTLNKYSAALQKVGISIYDQAGGLKEMDTILDEMGAKWGTLAKDQQVALAQTVAGVRQYNQLVSLMDNWDYFGENLSIAQNSTGVLDKQAEIYAESWEASKDRVTASLEEIYATLMDEDFFIGLNDGLTVVIGGISDFIDSIGGVKGVLLLLGSIITKVFSNEISTGINNAIQNMRIFSGVTQTETAKIKQSARDIALAMTKDMDSIEIDAMRQSLSTTYESQEKLQKLSKRMSADQLAAAEAALKVAQSYNDQAIAAGKAADAANRLRESQKTEASATYGTGASKNLSGLVDTANLQAGTDLVNTSREFITTAERIGLVTEEAQTALRNYANALRTGASSEQMTQTSNALLQALDNIAKEAPNATQAFSDFQGKVDNAATRVVGAASKFQTLKDSIEAKTISRDNIAEQIRKVATEAGKAGLPLKGLGTAIKNFQNVSKSSAKGSKEYEAALDELIKVFNTTKYSTEEMNSAIMKTAEAPKGASQAFAQEADSARRAAVENISAGNAINKAAEESAKAALKINTASLAYKSMGSAINGSLQGLSSFAMGLTSLKSAFDTLNNPDMGTFEKFTSILMSLSMGLPMIITSFTTLGNVIKFVTSSTTDGLTAQLAYSLGMTDEAMATSYLVVSKEGLEISRYNNAAAAAAEAAATEGATVVTQIETAAVWKDVAGQLALKLAKVALAAVIVGALVGAIYLAVKAYNADAEAAKKAAEASKGLAEKAEEAAQNLEKISSAFENYDNLVDALNQCTKGTEEWNAALKAVNDEVLNIIKNNPELAKTMEIERNADGMLSITNKDEVLEKAETMANSASYAASMGAVTASQAQLKSDTTDLRRDVGSYTMGYNGDSATYYNAGQVIAEHYQELAGLTAEEFEAAIRELTAGAKEMYGATDYQYEQMIDSLMGYQSEIDNLAVKANEAALQLENMANMIAEQELGEDYDAASKEIASEAYEEAYQDIYDEVIAQGKDGINKWSGKNDEEVKDFWARYSEATGTNYSLSGNAVQGTDSNRYFEYLENGEKKTISLEEAAAAIAATEALTAMGTAADEAANIIGGLSVEGQKFATGIANSKQADGSFDTANYLQDFTQAQLEAVKNGLDLEANTIDTNVLDMFGLSIDDFNALAEQFGMTGQELMQALLDGANDALSSLSDAEVEKLKYVDTSNMTVAEQKAFVTNKQNVYDQFSAAGSWAGLNLIEQENSGSAKELNEFYTALAGVNLTAEDATEQVEALVEEFGLTGTGVEYLINNVDALDKQFNVSSASINEQAAGLKEITDSLNTGDVISAEDIALLEQAGIDTSDYFAEMADGSFMLTAAAEEFKGLVESITLEALKDQVKDFDRAREQVATGEWFDKYLTDSGVVEGSFKANAGGSGYIGNESADDLGRARLNYINQFEAGSFDFNEEQLQLLTDYQTNPELALTSEQLQQIADMIDVVNQKQGDLQSQLFTSASSLAELDAIAKDLGSYDYSAYADGLINLASQYDNCADEIEEFQVALMSGSEAAIKAAEDNLRAATIIGEAAEKYDLEAEVLEAQADRLAKAYGISAEAAANMAVKNQRMNKGVSSLVDNWDDWKKQLKATDKLTQDYAEAVVDCTAAIADLVGASSDLELPDEFFNTENMALLERAAQGDIDAINALGAEVAYFTVDALEFNQAFADLAIGLESFNGFDVSGIDLSNVLNAAQFSADKDLVLQGISDIKNGLIAEGQSMGDDWVAALNRMAITTGMSVEQMNGLLGSLGVQAKVETTYVKQPIEVPTYTEVMEPGQTVRVQQGEDENGNPNWVEYTGVKKYSVPGEPMTVEGYAAVAQISTEDNPLTVDINESVAGGSAPMSNGQRSGAASYTPSRGSVAPSAKDGSGSGSGGGSTKPAEKTDTTKKEDVVDRYKELNDALDDVADAMEDVSKEADRLYGKARIDKIKQQNAYIQQEIGLLKDKLKLAKDTYLVEDKQALLDAAEKAGVTFTFDEAGNISNYTKEMEELYAELRTAQDAWNADYQNKTSEEQQEYEENIIKPIQDKIDELKEAIDAYEETRELIEDLENEIDDKFYEWQDNNYEILHYELEIEIEINDLELEYIDYYLNKITDDFYAMAEAAQYMNNQIPVITDSLGQYENFYNKITSAYAAGEISQADYVEGMQESYSAILDQLSALNDLDKEMMHYYEETLDAASEELSYYTDQMEHLTSVLEHYRNIVELVNGEFDYEAIGTILEGQAKTLKNELDAATTNYQMLLTEQAAAEEAYRNAQDEAARELYAEELKAITAQVDEAHDLMLSKTEEWAEAQKAIMENTMAKAAHEMEMAFSNGMGFDALNDSLDRLNSYADEYLTKTNQIYETQTLINTAQKAIDKTTNEAAKARLKSYTEEIQQLQEKNKLSNLELEIAKAKYDVLLAEIALEEAQNAKSTVRLQRDSEGNFGYVYTADQEAVSKAEQDLMDAQNALYNIGLEGTNEYGQKLLELQQQLADQLVALEEARAAGQFATEAEYYAARDQLIAEYTDLFTAYSEQYTTALGVDTAIQEEAWVNAYDNMIDKSLDWKDKTTEYTEKCEDAYKSWRDVVESESEVVDGILNDLEQEVKDVTEESDDLRDEVVNKVIPAIKNQLVSVRNVTSAYAAQRSTIQQLISYYEQLTQSILKAIQAQAGLSDSMGSEPSGASYDPNTDYSAVMAGYLAAGGTVGSDTWNELEAQREAKIEGEGYSKDYYGSRVGEDDYNPEQMVSNKWYKDKDAVNDKLKELGIQTFATGGYTGLWGPEGRLAMLHEKELILNPDDTTNFLAATTMLRDIASVIDINALRNQMSILPYISTQLLGTSGEIEQHVQIEAHFPSVTDRNEIEEAFNNLVNTAAQYANRKR